MVMFRCILILIVVISVSLETAAEQEAVNAARRGAPRKRSDDISLHLKKRDAGDEVRKRVAPMALSESEKTEILSIHNSFRRSENASNIHNMVIRLLLIRIFF